MLELTEQQRHALGEGPLRFIDPETQENYVVVRAEQFDQMRAVIDGITRRAGWDDPKLNEYERYRKQS